MSRLLFLAAVIALVYWLIKSYRKQLPGENTQKENNCGVDSSAQPEDMVRCAHCGVHLPKSESNQADGKFYCGEAHRRAHTGKSE